MITSRVSTAMMFSNLTGVLQNNLQNLLNLQRQMSTQTKYFKLSDNPSEIARALSLKSSMASNLQYISNQEDAISMLKFSEETLEGARDALKKIRDLVLQAGNGSLDPSAVSAIADDIEAQKALLLNSLNAKIAGKYVFGGTNTTTPPFVIGDNGQIRYVGSDERIRYEVEQGVLSDVSFTGSDLLPNAYQSYFICSHYVPIDWQWTGREEKVQISVGNRTLSVFIPEQWIDEVATGATNFTDYNQFRDPDEVKGISLDDLAMLVNRALKEQGADMLVTATVEKDYASNQQRLIFKSNTGEAISVTDWPDTDYLPMPQSLAGLTWDANNLTLHSDYWNGSQLIGSSAPDFTAIGGSLAVYYDNAVPVQLPPIDLGGYTGPQNAASFAAWLNTQPQLAANGITASAQGNNVVFTGPGGAKLQIAGAGAGAVLGSPVSGDWNKPIVGSNAPNFAGMTAGTTLDISVTPAVVVNLGAFVPSLPPGTAPTAEALADWLNTGNAGGSYLSSSIPPDITASVQGGKIVLTALNGGKIQLDGTGVTSVMGGASVSAVPKYSGLMGSVTTLGWKGDGLGKKIDIAFNGNTYTFDLDGYGNITELVTDINAKIPVSAGDLPFASLVSGRLVLQSTLGEITVSDTPGAGSEGVLQLFGYDGSGGNSLTSSLSSLTLKLGDNYPIKIYINKGDDLEKIAGRLNAIEGVYSRTSANGSQLVVVAQRMGSSPSDPLAVDAAAEKLHYPPFTLWGEGMAMSLFEFSTYEVDRDTSVESGVVSSKEQTRPLDHSHIDVFDYLGMETALTSREYKLGETITVKPGEELHWRVISGGHVTDIKLNAGSYTLEQIGERLRNAGVGWLEVVLDPFRQAGLPSVDDHETGLGTSYNEEPATSRLVIRGLDGSAVSIMDMNETRYAEELGLSTALRTDEKMGMKEIRFPMAPCLDSNLVGLVRVQKTCGQYFDVRLTRKDVIITDPQAGAVGTVDRVKVMEQIAKQVNAQVGFEMMRVVIPVDANGKQLTNSASLAAVTGEPFEVVDLPIPDPNWSAYSSGIAAQMGIHGGVTSLTKVKDDEKFGVTGTIRFESLAHSVEIDVSANDTVKSVMDRLRAQAGDWLYVNYFDANMGNSAGQEGDVPIISIAAKDGSAVNVIDVSGAIAQDQMLLNTSVQGGVDLSGWLLVPNSGPSAAPQTFSVTVAGYTHTIDLAAMRDVNGNGQLDAQDLVATINARMQDYDVRAELNKNGKLVLWSPRGYSIEASSNLGIQITAAPAPGAPASFTADTVVAGGGPAYAGFAAKNVFTVKSSGNVAPTAAAPANPSAGDAYLDTATGEIYTYNGAAWNVAAALAADEACLVDGSGDVYYCSAPGTVTSLGTHSGTPGTLDVLDAGNTVYTYDNATDPANPRWVAYGAYGFLGNTPSSSSPYRDGYGLEGSNQPGAVRKAPGIYTQNVISRGGANQTQQNFFGVLDDIVAAVRSENRDGLSDKLLPLIDKFMDGLLKVISMGGALQGRYEASIARMKMNDITMTEAHDDVVGIDLAEISTQLLMAQTMYQASLGVISFIVQPTLLDFLR